MNKALMDLSLQAEALARSRGSQADAYLVLNFTSITGWLATGSHAALNYEPLNVEVARTLLIHYVVFNNVAPIRDFFHRKKDDLPRT